MSDTLMNSDNEIMYPVIAEADAKPIGELLDDLSKLFEALVPNPFNAGEFFRRQQEGLTAGLTDGYEITEAIRAAAQKATHPLGMLGYEVRDEITRKYAWAIPTFEAVTAIAMRSPIVEIGAGTGYWAKLIAEAGGEIIAFDEHPPPEKRNIYHGGREVFFDVQVGGVEKAKKYPKHTLFLRWPPYGSDMARRCLSAYKGDTVIYIGESKGGCTGDNKFHAALERGWEEEKELRIPQWPGIHDSLMIFTRKKKGQKNEVS